MICLAILAQGLAGVEFPADLNLASDLGFVLMQDEFDLRAASTH